MSSNPFKNRKLKYPLVSIVMGVYNDEKYLAKALTSIVSQTYKNWELIIVDDASTDSSPYILKAFSNKYHNIKVLTNKKNLGLGKCLDKAISCAKGIYIARMDGDDISFSKRLEWQVLYLLDNPDVVALGGQIKLIDYLDRAIGKKEFPLHNDDLYKMLYYAIPIQHPSLLVNTKLLPLNFSWYDGWRKAQDLYLYFKLVKYGKLSNVKQFILKYRYYSEGVSLKDPKNTFLHTKKIRKIARSQFGYTPTLKAIIISWVQSFFVLLLPNFIIRSLYPLFRRFVVFVSLGIDRSFEYVTEEVTQVPNFFRVIKK